MTESNEGQTVFVVDDDASIRTAMTMLLRSVDLRCECFESADDFLQSGAAELPGCLVLDIRMPGISGIELQAALADRGSTLPIIFVSGHGDIPMAVSAMRNGAMDFIQKPFRDQELLDRIHAALKADVAQRSSREELAGIHERIARLTNREREVFDLIVTGRPNKVIAFELDVSQRTVEIHRARVMEKMQARSLAELVRMHLSVERPKQATSNPD